MRVFLLGTVLLATACAPSVEQLVVDRHYREAICAASEDEEEEALVTDALVEDADLHVHAHKLTEAEIARVVGDSAAAVQARVDLVRVRLRSNALPLDEYNVELSIVDRHGAAGAAPASWPALAYATGEPLPPNRQDTTYLTGMNVLKGLGAVLTVGLTLPFTEFHPETVAIAPFHEDFQRTAPKATALYDAITTSGGCQGIPGGVKSHIERNCDTYFVLDHGRSADWELDVSQWFGSNRILGEDETLDEDDKCGVSDQSAIALDALGGPAMHRLAESPVPVGADPGR